MGSVDSKIEGEMGEKEVKEERKASWCPNTRDLDYFNFKNKQEV